MTPHFLLSLPVASMSTILMICLDGIEYTPYFFAILGLRRHKMQENGCFVVF